MEPRTGGTGEQGLGTEDLLSAEPGEPERVPAADAAGDGPQLFAEQEIGRFREDWQSVQIRFVDDPQRAVREADELVAAVIRSLASTFAEHKTELESQWSQGEAATEDLRLAFRQYRAFFNQLLDT
ncbi:hypothetical protein [Amycolatopsis minnesotensis]|uniref:Uncharacterized protein n=1 Tax=Amycolatopsis minnesotensis TaxID=337894 RepID=A0ABN2SSJ3_9PSEU